MLRGIKRVAVLFKTVQESQRVQVQTQSKPALGQPQSRLWLYMWMSMDSYSAQHESGQMGAHCTE